MQRDLGMLSRFIQLPQGVLDATWETLSLGESAGIGPNDWVLVAVLHLEPAALQPIVASATKLDQDNPPTIEQPFVLGWFPESVRSQLTQFGPTTLRFSKPAYRPDAFVRSPLLNGYFITISQREIFLFLQTS